MDIVDKLINSEDPCIRLRASLKLKARRPAARKIKEMQTEVANSDRVTALLSERDKSGEIPHHPYSKWRGAHWVLADLADIGYPAGDTSLIPLREQVYGWLFAPYHIDRFLCIEGKWRRCASQEGNAIYYLNRLGLADERTGELVKRLEKMQWPDGGWNCRKDKSAKHSSFMETLTPMRGLIAHADVQKSRKARSMAKAASDIFLKRHLYLRQSNGEVMRPVFTKLHHPNYWHYDILFGLRVLGEGGFAKDKRCDKALDLIESKALSGGGFPSEARYYRPGTKTKPGSSLVTWGATGKKTLNEYVTVDALGVLKEAGRLSPTA